jgi:hypothetical protein
MFTADDQEARLLDHQLRVLHVLGEARPAVQLAEVREHLVAHHPQHLEPAELLEVLPASAGRCFPRTTRAKGFLCARPALVGRLHHVEQAREHQERDLLDDRERVGDAAGPELGPELVDVALLLR